MCQIMVGGKKVDVANNMSQASILCGVAALKVPCADLASSYVVSDLPIKRPPYSTTPNSVTSDTAISNSVWI
jgi:hypothetical protein